MTVLESEEDSFVTAFDNGMALAIDSYSASEGGSSTSAVVMNSITSSSSCAPGVDATYTITSMGTNPDFLDSAVRSDAVCDAVSSSLQDSGFRGASVGGVSSTNDRSPSRKPSPMPTADVVSVLVVESFVGVDGATAESERFQSTLSGAVGSAVGVPAKQVQVVTAVQADDGSTQVLLVCTEADVSPKALTAQLESAETQAAIMQYMQDSGYGGVTVVGASVSNMSPTSAPTLFMPTHSPTSSFVVLQGTLTVHGITPSEIDTTAETARLTSTDKTALAGIASATPSSVSIAAGQVTITDIVVREGDVVDVEYTIIANDASNEEMRAALSSCAAADVVTYALKGAGFDDADARCEDFSSIEDLSPTAAPTEAPNKVTKYPSPQPTPSPTSQVAQVLVHQGVSGVDAAAYERDPIGFEAALKAAVRELLETEEAETKVKEVQSYVVTDDATDDGVYGPDNGPSAAPAGGGADGPSAAPAGGGDGPSTAPATGPSQAPVRARGPTSGPAAGPTGAPAVVGPAPTPYPVFIPPTMPPTRRGKRRTQDERATQESKGKRSKRRTQAEGEGKNKAAAVQSSSAHTRKTRKSQLQQDRYGEMCTMTTQYQVAVAKHDSSTLGSTLSHENATEVLTKYLQWYGFLTAVACPDPYIEDESPTPSPTTMQPSVRPSTVPTARPTVQHLALLSALQEINGLTLKEANNEVFQTWFQNYTAFKAGVPAIDVNVTGAFPASVFINKTMYVSTHDPARGFGAPEEQTVIQYSVQSSTISEADLLYRLNRAILTNETTAALAEGGYPSVQDIYRIQVVVLSPTAYPTAAPVPTNAPTLIPPPGPLSDAAVAGIAVGAVAGVVALLSLGYYSYVHLFLRKAITAV